MKTLIALITAIITGATAMTAGTPEQKETLNAFLDRIGGEGARELIMADVDTALSNGGKDVFVIGAEDGKPSVRGSNVLATTAGINYYLNHYAGVNLSWNNLTTDLKEANLRIPEEEERRECEADYRYYLNYCTFSYSMSPWTWERWEKEIDWMALHGINMPLQITGLDTVWRNLLMNHYGYSKDEANKFIAGPCFQAWWGMNNLEGWGGENPDWWYERQENLAKSVCRRERELGMSPVLPGFAGMVPSDFTEKTGIEANNQGKWCGFVRPYILDPNSERFAEVAGHYYDELHKVMGESEYYSLDPFHEGANTKGIDVPAAYGALYDGIKAANPAGKWVIQQWQWSKPQYEVLDRVPQGELIILDLFSDAKPNFGAYKGHDAVYCSLPNFGGRTGLMGRLNGVAEGYGTLKDEDENIKGIGATPEAIGQVPVLYDMLFELPWLGETPDPAKWVAEYTEARYGTDNAKAKSAWEKLRTSALDCRSTLQGPHEAVICARPGLDVDRVSSWGGTEIFYDPQAVVDAAFDLAEADLSGENYSYDLTDVTRQALTDYSKQLLGEIKEAHEAGDSTTFGEKRDRFLELILDIDELLNTNRSTMLGEWTEMARAIADEMPGTTEADRDWLELDNARTLITTWGERVNADDAGLRDYSYRAWGGMLRDFYYERWKKWFDSGMAQNIDWYEWERAWAHDGQKRYGTEARGDSKETARRLLQKYFGSAGKG